MKNIFLILILCIFGNALWSQTDGMSYQAVILDPELQLPGVNDLNNVYNNKELAVRFTIYNADDAIEFQETHWTKTDAYGMINLVIGAGTPVQGLFTEIFWDGTRKSLKVEIKLDASFEELSMQDLLFVPYAFHRDIIATGFLKVDGPVTFNGTLDVGGKTTFHDDVTVANGSKTELTGDLIVDGTTNLNSSLSVNNNSPVDFSGDLVVDGTTNLNNTLSVNNGTATTLTGSLEVDGVSNLNNKLFVNNYAPTYLTGTLNVDGASRLNSTLWVQGMTNLEDDFYVNNGSASFLSGNLTVDGTTNLNSDLNVNNGSSTYLSGSLLVGGNTGLNGSLDVQGTTTLNDDLLVTNASTTSLSGDLNVDGYSNLGNDLNVLNQSLTTLSGDLIVDGVTNLNNGLYVNNQSPTELSGDLLVGGAFNLLGDLRVYGTTTLDQTLDVGGATVLGSTLTTTGISYFNNNINVSGVSNLNNTLNVAGVSNLNSSLNVAGVTTLNDRLFANGQVTIRASLTGSDADYNAHPLRVEGSGQGIAIKLTAGVPNNDNNFITFYNSAGGAVGRIEGETYAERIQDDEYLFEQGILIAEEVVAVANVALAAIPIVVAGFGASAGPDIGGIAIAAADLVLATANLIAFEEFNKQNIGVTYQSGSADYAEWLERLDANENILPADIVGVYAGKITKYTEAAPKLMVISTKPAVLGNMPMEGEEGLYEKVAFMGQIPVKVRGVVRLGDYIIPSGLNDGTGVAVDPEHIAPEQYAKIVGVAWEESLIDLGHYNVINMAIGLNNNDVAKLAVKQSKKIEELESRYASLEARLEALENGGVYQAEKDEKVEESSETSAEASIRPELIAENMPAELSDEIMNQAFEYLRSNFIAQGYVIEKHPGLNKLFNDPVYKNEVIVKAKATYQSNYQKSISAGQSILSGNR